jgi:hypothetical protein
MYDTLIIDFPSEFVNSVHEKVVIVESIRCIDLTNEKDYFAASACSDIIQDNHYADYFLAFCDKQLEFKKYLSIYDAKTKFSIWFRDMNRQLIDLDPSLTRVVIELKLEF